jgi:hypothetical protein
LLLPAGASTWAILATLAAASFTKSFLKQELNLHFPTFSYATDKNSAASQLQV